MTNVNKIYPNHPISPAWRYLGSDEEDLVDYYVVNEVPGDDSLTGVQGEEAGDYWSYPIHLNSSLAQVQSAPDDRPVKKCYNLYAAQGGKYIHDGAAAQKVDADNWLDRELGE